MLFFFSFRKHHFVQIFIVVSHLILFFRLVNRDFRLWNEFHSSSAAAVAAAAENHFTTFKWILIQLWFVTLVNLVMKMKMNFFLFLVYKNSEEENYMDIIILSERILNECHVSVVWWSSSSFVCVGEKKLTFFFSFQFFFHSVEIEIRFFLFIWKLGVKFTFISVYLMTWIKLKLYSDQDDDDLDCEKLLSEKIFPVVLFWLLLAWSFHLSIRFDSKEKSFFLKLIKRKICYFFLLLLLLFRLLN